MRRGRWRSSAALLGGGIWIAWACGGPTGEPPCPEGSEGCACTPDDECDPELSCLSHVCVRGPVGEGGTNGDDEIGGAGGESEDPTAGDAPGLGGARATGGGSSSGGEDGAGARQGGSGGKASGGAPASIGGLPGAPSGGAPAQEGGAPAEGGTSEVGTGGSGTAGEGEPNGEAGQAGSPGASNGGASSGGASSGGASSGGASSGGTLGTPLFVEDFEDGDTDGWYLAFPDNYSFALDEGTGADGTTRSLRVVKDENTPYCCDGFIWTFSPTVAPDSISYWVSAGDGAGSASIGYVALQSQPDASAGVAYSFFYGGYLYMVGGNSQPSLPYTPDQWYNVVLREIDWENGTFEYYVDGSPIASLTMLSSPASLARIDLFTAAPDGTPSPNVYYDEIVLR